MQVQSLGREAPLEEGMGTHSSILAWRIPWTEEPGGCSPRGCKESDTTERTRRQDLTAADSRPFVLLSLILTGAPFGSCTGETESELMDFLGPLISHGLL